MTARTEPDEMVYLRPGEAARILGVHERTLTNWANQGQIRWITLPSGHRRYVKSDVIAITRPSAESDDLPP